MKAIVIVLLRQQGQQILLKYNAIVSNLHDNIHIRLVHRHYMSILNDCQNMIYIYMT